MALTIGSRGSKLALWQAEWVRARLLELGAETRIEVIKTSGDLFQSGPLKQVGNKGLFTKEIEEALLEGRVDVAVHSLKDMPTVLPDGLQITATPPREDVRDALIGSTLAGLGEGARVGTGSLRRAAQLKAWREDLQVLPVRGNVDTRLRKLDAGEFDAIVLASAGLNRLGWAERIGELIPIEVMCPAVGQGSLAIETRADGGEACAVVERLNHGATRAAITAERGVLAVLGGGCQVPVGAYGQVREGGGLHVRAVVLSPDGKEAVKSEVEGAAEEALALGMELGKDLLARGADRILAAFREAGL